MRPELFEMLANLEHDRWARWQRYLHSRCTRNPDGSLTIPAESVAHWERQIETPYWELSERERDSDRKEVLNTITALACVEIDEVARMIVRLGAPPKPLGGASCRWWVSWYGRNGVFELHSPWWVSGFNDEHDIFCAAVLAENTKAAKQVILDAHDKGHEPARWRFVNPMAQNWSPFCGRFPRADWMQWPDTPPSRVGPVSTPSQDGEP